MSKKNFDYKVTVNFEDAGKKTVDGSVIELEKI